MPIPYSLIARLPIGRPDRNVSVNPARHAWHRPPPDATHHTLMPDTGPNDPPRAPRRWPVRLILVGIVFALVLPGLVFSAVLLDRIATAERTRSQDAAQAAAIRAAEALDREIGNLAAALLALSTSPALDRHDLAAFQRQAEAVAGTLGQSVVLATPDGQQVVNTRRPLGAPLPRMGSMETMQAAIATRATAVSNLFTGGSAGQPAVAVEFPVIRNGQVAYVLAMSLQPQYLSTLMQKQGLPPGWLASVIDANDRVVARTVDIDRFVGKTATADVVAHAAGDRDLWIGLTLDGTRVLIAMHRLRLAGWRVVIGVPIALVEAPLRSTITLLAITGVVTLGIAVILAWALATSVATPLQRLARAAAAAASGLPVARIRSPIAEVDAVSRALVLATRDLESQVTARTTELEAANQRLRDEAAAREAAEEQLRQAQKMEAVGQLTGGIAHDFNNLLTIVIGSLDLLRRRSPDDRSRRLLDNALDGAARAATLTARLLAFSRRQPLMPRPLDPNQLVTGMSDLLRRTLGDAVRVETVLAGGVWQAHVDPNQLENALLNLAVNGRDAIAAHAGTGSLTIETANAVLDAEDLVHHPDVPQGEYVRLSVSDTGAGMPADIAARAFEPFFTTKPQGQGTGLGLSQVHGFVKQSGGHLQIETAPGAGTTVSLFLPRFDGAALAPDEPAAETPASADALTILVVEDDAGVRRYSAEALRELGHAALEAENAGAALRLLDAHPEIALLLTDVLLPGQDGPALALEARRRRPGLPVLYASGFTAEDPATDGKLPRDAVLLQKPFTIQALAAKLDEALRP